MLWTHFDFKSVEKNFFSCCLISTNWTYLFFRTVTINIEKQEKHPTGPLARLCAWKFQHLFFAASLSFQITALKTSVHTTNHSPAAAAVNLAVKWQQLTVRVLKHIFSMQSAASLHSHLQMFFFSFFFNKMWEGIKMRLAEQKINQDGRRVNLCRISIPVLLDLAGCGCVIQLVE